MSNSNSNPVKLSDVGNNQLSIMTNIWSLVSSIQTLKSEMQTPTQPRPDTLLTPLQHAQAAVIENTIMTVTSFVELANLGQNTPKNDGTQLGVAFFRLSRNSIIFKEKWNENVINPANLQNIIANSFEVVSLVGKKNKAISIIFSTASDIITNIINSQQNPDGTNSADVDIPFSEFFNANNATGFALELGDEWAEIVNSLTFGATGSVSNAITDVIYTTSEIIAPLTDDYIAEAIIGSKQSEALEGDEDILSSLFGADDRIYGMGGNDILKGGKGNDYLNGGSGDDILIGGEDSDILIGAEGFDTYHIADNDTIFDSDAQGRIFIDGKQLPKVFNTNQYSYAI